MKGKSITKILFLIMLAALQIATINLNGQSVNPSKTSDSLKGVSLNSIDNRFLIDYESDHSILFVESKDKQIKTWSNVYLSTDAAVFSTNTLNPIGNGIGITNARLAIKSTLSKNWKMEFELDFKGSTVSLKDAYLLYGFSNAYIKAGNFKEPFSMEALADPQHTSFIENSLVGGMSPGRHLGISGAYKGAWYMASAGVFFNDIGSLKAVENTNNQNRTNGLSEGVSFTGRAVANPILEQDLMVHIGVGGSYRQPKTHDAINPSYRYSTHSLSSINKKEYIDTDIITDIDFNLLANIELAAMYKNICFQGEYINNGIFRKNNQMMYVLDGFYARAGILLFGSNYKYNQAEGYFIKPKITNSKGELELAIRYDYSNANGKNARLYGGAGEGYTAAINWMANDYVRIQFNYSYLRHDRYANGAGEYFVYEDENGNQFKEIYEMDLDKAKAGEKFSIFSLRLELEF